MRSTPGITSRPSSATPAGSPIAPMAVVSSPGMTTTCTPVVSSRATTESTCSCDAPGVITTITVATSSLTLHQNEYRLGRGRPMTRPRQHLRNEPGVALDDEPRRENAACARIVEARQPAAGRAHAHDHGSAGARSDAAANGHARASPGDARHRAEADGDPPSRLRTDPRREQAGAFVADGVGGRTGRGDM